jgi:hypothetical protein
MAGAISYTTDALVQIQDLNKFIQTTGDRRYIAYTDFMSSDQAKNTVHSWSNEALQGYNTVLSAALTSTTGTAITLAAGTNTGRVRLIAGKSIAEIADERVLVTSIVTVATNYTTVNVTRGYNSTATASTAYTGVGAQFRLVDFDVAEGADADRDDSTFATTLLNYTQIFDHQIRLSGTLQAIESAYTNGGKEGSILAQQYKGLQEILLKVERAIFDGIQASGVSNATRKMGGLKWWATQYGVVEDASGTPLTVQMFDAQIKKMLDLGADPSNLTAYMSLTQLQNLQKYKADRVIGGGLSGKEKTIDNSWDEYISPGGARVTMKWSAQLKPSEVYIVQAGKMKFVTLQNRQLVSNDLAKTGDSDRKQLLMEGTLEVNNPRECLYLIKNLSTAPQY